MKRITVAMDGPVGAGKSSIADAVAQRLNILHLDTGAMYRTLGLACVRVGIDMEDEKATTDYVSGVFVSVAFQNGAQQTLLNGEDVTGLIRTEQVGIAASKVSRYAGVRKLMVKLQQEIAEKIDVLVDGRDICLRVLPNAGAKIYLTASAEERAKRRWLQLQQKGDSTSFAQVLADLRLRDEQDMNRSVDPLRPTEDAVIVDSTSISFEETVDQIVKLIEEKYHE